MPALLKKYQDRENGFTLVELLIVVLIIGILAAVAIPVYLGIQQQGYKAAVKSDVNISVKRVQVALTEGKTVADAKANPTSVTQKSVKGENVYLAASTTPGAGDNDYSISGVLNTTTTPAGPINYSYTYDSVTGQFTESSSGLAFGSANPSIVITTTTLPDGVKDAAYSRTLVANAVSPTSTTTWSITGLPAGLTYTAATGVISGAPTAAGSSTVVATATNGSVSDTRTYTLNVGSVPTVTTSTLPNGVVGTAYSQTLAATGTPTPTFAQSGGTLPTGLTLTSAGVLAGNPSATGTFTFGVTANNTNGTSAAQSFTIIVNSKPAITTASFPGAIQYSSGYAAAVASTGTPSATYTATGLPSGMTINSSTGAISGDAGTVATTYNVSVTATNTAGSDTKQLNLVISPNLVTNGSFESGSANWNFNPSGPAVVNTQNCPAPAGTITPYHGTNQLLFYSGNTGEYKTFLQDISTPVVTGKMYGAGMWVNGCSQAGQAGTLFFSSYDASGNVTVMKQVPYTSTSGWTYVGTTVAAPTNGVGIRIQFVTTNNYGNVVFDYANAGAIQ